jgi:hypothetical protein
MYILLCTNMLFNTRFIKNPFIAENSNPSVVVALLLLLRYL